MSRPLAIVVSDDWAFRDRCRGPLDAAGLRVAVPTSRDGAEYFLASAYPPSVVVFSERERWDEILREAVRRAVRPIAAVVVGRASEAGGGAPSLAESVRAALERLASTSNEWRGVLTLGVEAIDAPHRVQVSLLNAVESAIRSGPMRERRETFEELRNHAELHFAGEESLMKERGYPERDEHAREHVRLLGEIAQLAARCAGEDPPPASRVVLSLRDWLEGHILTLDRALARHLAGAPACEAQ